MKTNLLAVSLVFAVYLDRPVIADRASAHKENELGRQAEAVGKYEEAYSRYTRAIEEDPTLAGLRANRALLSRLMKKQVAGLEDIRMEIELPGGRSQSDWELIRLMLLADLCRWNRLAIDAPEVAKKWPENVQILQARGIARLHVGEIDAGLADLRAAQVRLKTEESHYGIPEAYLLRGEPAEALKVIDEIRANFGRIPRAAVSEWMRARVDAGEFEGLKEEYNAMVRSDYSARLDLAYAYASGTPQFKLWDPNESIRVARKTQAEFGYVEAYWIEARTEFLSGRYSNAISAIDRGGREEDFWCLFWKGMSLLKFGSYSEARVLLTEARRRNPYFLKLAAKIPGVEVFATQVDKEVSREAARVSAKGGPPTALALRRLTIPEIEGAALAVRFRRALAEYRKLPLEEFSDPAAVRIRRRMEELAGAADAMDRMIKSINSGGRKIEVAVGTHKLKATGADDEGFQFQIEKGSGRFPWSSMDPWDLYCLVNGERLSGKERGGLAAFLWDAGEIRRGSSELQSAAGLAPDMRAALDESIAFRRGMPVPEGGFVFFKGDWVTLAEKEKLQAGLVLYEGEWVSASDRVSLKKGMVKLGDKWVTRTEKELVDRGWKKVKGAWMSPEDDLAFHRDWKNAWESTTEHFQIRTNASESLVETLGGMLEAALIEIRAYEGGGEVRPAAGKKIQALAFHSFADYRAYCEKSGSLDKLNAAGFARTDSDTVVGWNKTGNEADLCATMVHELAHYVSFRLHPGVREPSWFAEGTATWFEGARFLDGKWSFHSLVDARLQLLQAELARGRKLDLEGLLKKSAQDLLNADPMEGLLFYSTSWALVYYLETTGDSRTRKAFEEFKKGLWVGGSSDLKQKFPDLKALEAAVTAFVVGL